MLYRGAQNGVHNHSSSEGHRLNTGVKAEQIRHSRNKFHQMWSVREVSESLYIITQRNQALVISHLLEYLSGLKMEVRMQKEKKKTRNIVSN